MFGPLGFQEVLLILALALLIFGPRELPRIGRTIGRAMGEFRKASTELKRTINAEMIEDELRQHDPRRLVRETAKELEAAAMREDSETGDAPEAGGEAALSPSADSPPNDEAVDGSVPVPRDSSANDAGS